MAFHWKDGWYFERIKKLNSEKDGSVRIYRFEPGCLMADVDIEIDPDSWASIVASVCSEGETKFTFEIAKTMHSVPRSSQKRALVTKIATSGTARKSSSAGPSPC